MSGAPALKTILVCQYTPPGNFLGQFAANVLPAATTSSPSPTPASPGVSPSPVAPCAANACGAKVAARNNLGAGSCLVMNKAGDSVCARSSDKRYFFCIQNDAEVALYDKGQRIWAAGVAGASTKRPFRLCFEKTGALVAYEQVDKKTRRSYWSSQSSGAKPLKFWVQTTGVAEILSGKNTKKTTATTVWKVPTTP
ncbi:hypothetical protein MNEG_6245 [Monoraphidium neglectum]|uniref:Bulb-type lectin domain-containing protein n=1 Tax=Monoraphidium neglectum TaxID=145388 RepID=A0A0D2MF03_9CHLO|nr:hypothetical protein MNEG_6245 [Monoraphidium neglectum]KIZ01720.1 hypothetical protein MNEG_6245 [Monoraphidium neglectum]|eukprot:XP_013900739.1 hypothetical protein MNEG_6245 [Monoraphidium neglectum]